MQDEEAALSPKQSEQAHLHVVIEHLDAFQKQLASGLDELDWHARREVIRLLVKRVEIDRNDVRVIYKVNLLRMALPTVKSFYRIELRIPSVL